MGTFLGHAAPGLFLILFSIWWTFASLNRYYMSKYKKGRRYRSSAAFLCTSCCCGKVRKWPIESVMKIICAIMGVVAELITAHDERGRFAVGNAQHMTMYALFGSTGIVDMLLHYGVQLPPNTDYFIAIIAFVGESLLFQFHVHVHMPLAVVMHKLLLYSIYAAIISLAAELRWPNNVLCTIGRCFSVGLQGTWFWQIAIYVYVLGNGKVTDHEEIETKVEMVAIYFCWHMMSIFVFIMLVAVVINRYHRSPDGMKMREHDMGMGYNANEALLSESEEEMEDQSKRENGVAFTQEGIGLLPMAKIDNP